MRTALHLLMVFFFASCCFLLISAGVTNKDFGTLSEEFFFTGLPVSASGTNTICTANNGTATATASVTGGTGTVTYVWSNGATGASISGLPVGTYTVTATGANGACGTATVSVGQTITPIAVSVSGTDTSCGLNNGSATASVSGGTGTISYAWNNGGSGATISNLAAGTYFVTATDVNGCEGVGSVMINPSSALTVSTSTTDETCFAADGTATAFVSGGTGTITYAWSNGGNTQSISNLSAGTYNVVATDALGCTGTATATVNQNVITLSVSTSSTNASCAGNDGTATAVASGGSGTITYMWSNGATGSTITGLMPGTYTVDAMDANGCVGSASVTVGQTANNLSVTTSTTDETCFAADGTATAFVSGGAGTITYAWSNGGNTQSISNLSAGTYNVVATDANGCTGMATATVNQNVITLSVSTSSTNASCAGNDGTATAVASGGSGTITYMWSNGATGSTITGLMPGTYTVDATDANGCVGSASVTVGQTANNIIVSVSTTNASCAGNDGTATASVTGGTGTITYLWSNGGMTPTITGLAPGAYYVTATDANGCSAIGSGVVGGSAGCYCPSYGQSTQYEWIESIAVNGIANPTGNDGGYGDYTSVVLPVETGSNSIQLTPGFAGSSYYEYWSVWIDLNHDMDFDDWGELVYYKASANQINKNFHIPTSATPGLTRMRISMKFGGWSNQCDIFPEGEVEDYTVNITVCDNVTYGGEIADDEVLCGTTNDPAEIYSVALPSGGSGTLEYVWLKNTVSAVPPPGNSNWVEIPNSNAPSYDPGPISQTTWYIRCARRSGCTEYLGESNVVEKAYQPNCNQTYCNSEGESTQYEWIKKVRIGSINNNSGNNNGYADFTNMSTTVAKGDYKTIVLKPGFSNGSYLEYWRVWVDWNQDGDFNDAGEKEVQAAAYGNLWKTISVPNWAATGATRMRVSMKYGGYATPCETFSEGEVEDYTINVVGSQNLIGDPNNEIPFENTVAMSYQSIDVNVYPNPAEKDVFVKIHQTESTSGIIHITNNLGQLIETRQVEDLSASPLQISLDNYQRGVYYINIQFENSETVTKKFIVTKP